MKEEAKESMEKICHNFSDIILLPRDDFLLTNKTVHKIETEPPTQRVYIRSYRLSQIQKDKITKPVKEWEKQGIVKPSKSPWNFQLIVISKKKRLNEPINHRIYIDSRKLNANNIVDAYPLQQVENILNQLGSFKYFSTVYTRLGKRVHKN